MNKKILFLPVIFLSVLTLAACGSHRHDKDGHDEHAEAKAGEHDGHGDNHDGHGSGREGHAEAIHLSAAEARAAGVATERISPAPFAEVIEVSGRILPAAGTEVTVAAPMSGIVALSGGALTEGAAVRAGQTLFTVSARTLSDGNPAASAAAELQAARAALDRAERLARAGAVAQKEADEARRRYAQAQATAQSLGTSDRTRGVAAPIGGYVKQLLVGAGEYVEAGRPLLTLTQTARLTLRAELPERFFGRIGNIVSANFRTAYGDRAAVYSLRALGGRLLSRGRTADEADCFVPVTFDLPNSGDIVPGSLAQVYLLGAERAGVLSVPNGALTEAQGLLFVYVQTGPDEYERREVTTGATDGLRTEVTGGLRAGERVVTRGAVQVRLAAAAGAVPEGHHH